MDDPTNPAFPYAKPSTMKEKNAVQRAVSALLDELAPERVLKRVVQLKGGVEQHRTPTGCVLQAPTAAISVSWFAKPEDGAPMGSLHVIVWSGTVTRRGSVPGVDAAKLIEEQVFHPMERAESESVWRAMDGTEYDSPALALRCLALLEEQVTRGGSQRVAG